MSTSNVYSKGWVPHTCIAMSSTIRISSYDETGTARQIGLIQSFKPTDTRKTERARGVGYGDRVAEIVPGMTDTTITCTRMALYGSSILSTFGYTTNWNQDGQGSVRTLAHMKNPFDITEVIWFHDGKGKKTVTMYHDCWVNNWSKTIEITGNLILMEDVTIDVTWVSDGNKTPDPYADTDAIPGMHGDCGKSGAGATAMSFNAGALIGTV